jgi:aconitate hydratase
MRIDQTLTQDATGTLVMLELEAMGLDRVRTELSAHQRPSNLGPSIPSRLNGA